MYLHRSLARATDHPVVPAAATARSTRSVKLSLRLAMRQEMCDELRNTDKGL
jgi:hypothetical protein